MSPQCTFRGGPYYHLGQGRCPIGHVLAPTTSLCLDPPGPHLKRLTRVRKISQQAHSIVQNKNFVHIILTPLLLQLKKYHKPRQTSSQNWSVLPNLKMNYASFRVKITSQLKSQMWTGRHGFASLQDFWIGAQGPLLKQAHILEKIG